MAFGEGCREEAVKRFLICEFPSCAEHLAFWCFVDTYVFVLLLYIPGHENCLRRKDLNATSAEREVTFLATVGISLTEERSEHFLVILTCRCFVR